ncbi:MAG: hypothetical protein J6Y01_07110, partial [Spirochaetales bacterium]|nr:hypothetical protein [Spirochaetales bacterium]
MTETTAVLGVGTSENENDISEAKIYTVGSGIAKFDLKGQIVPLYLNYKIADKAGNETVGSKKLTSSDRPPVTSDIGTKWVREATLNTLIASTTSGSMKYSELNFNAADGVINNLVFDKTMFGSSSGSTTVDCLAANGGESLTSGNKYSIIFIATRDSGLDAYEEKTFVYDNTAPFMSDVTVSEDFGAVYGRADTVNKRLSGKVTFSGYFHDYALGEQESVGDFALTVTVGTKTETAVITKTDELTDDYVKFLWNCEVDLSNLSCGSTTLVFSLKDKADNETKQTDTTYIIAPFILEIVEVSGAVKSVMRYGKPFDNASDTWCNTNYNERYSLRRGVTSVVVKGFNLNGATFKYNGTELSKSNASTVGATLTISSSAGSGTLTATNGTIVSDPKSITVFKNYQNDSTYKSMKTGDMVLKDDNKAFMTFQYNTSKHTFVLREYENSEGSFAVNTTSTNTYIAAGYNRFWFVNLCLDKKDGIAAQSNLADNKYYIFASDSEYNQDLHAQKGLQLWGRYNYWKDSNDIGLVRTWMSESQGDYVQMPKNDWSIVYPDTNKDPYTWGRFQPSMIEYKNHWRMSMPNNTSDGYDGGNNRPANKATNSPNGTADWSSDWGDVAAYNDQIHAVWHSLYDNKMYYRMLKNKTTQSAKYPDGGAVQFNFDGKYPAVTVADNNRPLIIAYDETNRKLKAFYYNGTITSISSLTQSGDSNWKSYEIASGEGVGLYPRIECQLNSAGTAIEGGIHLFYQDAQTGALCYGYASEIDNLGSATKIVIDTDCAPGYYNDIRLNESYITCTYIAYGNLGTGDAIRVARCSVSA